MIGKRLLLSTQTADAAVCVDTLRLFVSGAGASKLCNLVFSLDLMLLGRLASRNRESRRKHEGGREGGREWRIEHGRAPLGCHGSREMHPGIVCFQGEAGCLCSIGQLKADWLVDLLLIGCVTKIQSNIKSSLLWCFNLIRTKGISFLFVCLVHALYLKQHLQDLRCTPTVLQSGVLDYHSNVFKYASSAVHLVVVVWLKTSLTNQAVIKWGQCAAAHIPIVNYNEWMQNIVIQ